MPLNDLLADRETYSRAGLAFLRAQALEHLENPVPILGGDADSVVIHRKPPLSIRILGRDAYARRFLASKLYGIADQVLGQFSQLLFVSPNCSQIAAIPTI